MKNNVVHALKEHAPFHYDIGLSICRNLGREFHHKGFGKIAEVMKLEKDPDWEKSPISRNWNRVTCQHCILAAELDWLSGIYYPHMRRT